MITCILAQQNPARLIVRGDDMGYTHSGNEALMKCYKEDIETSIEVIVPSLTCLSKKRRKVFFTSAPRVEKTYSIIKVLRERI